jgi:hypothetical protein
MNTFKKLLIGSAIAASAMSSQAAIIDGQLGDGEFFVILNTISNNNSFIFDLGKTLSTFDINTNQSFNLASSPYYATFLSNNTANDPVRFGVIGADSQGPNTGLADSKQLYVTALANTTPANQSNSILATRSGNLDGFIGAVNGAPNSTTFSGNHGTTTDGSSLDTVASSTTSFGPFSGAFVAANALTMVVRGSSAELFKYGTSFPGTANTASVITDFFSATETSTNLGGYFTLSNAGVLDYFGAPTGPVVNPVPEASEWAMMLSGLAMVGLMVRRRRNNV